MDHAATTPVRPEVLEAMLPFITEIYGNASSIHQIGQRSKKALEEAREKVAALLGADPKEIYFTSGGTESDNLAIKGVAYANRDKGKHLVTSAIEHQAVLNCCRYLEGNGFDVTFLPVDQFGVIDLEAAEKALRSDPILITVMLANNETGTIQVISEIAELAKERGIPLHTDAVQALGKIPVEVDALGADLLTLSGHKFNGPKGVGLLYVRKGISVQPLMHGGHHERQLRAGTQNVAAIVGLAKAMELAIREMPQAQENLEKLRNQLEKDLLENIKSAHLNGHPERRLPNILNISFGSIDNESLLLALDMKGISVSTGSACTSGAIEPSHVLQAMGLDPGRANSSLRFSLGEGNTVEHVKVVVDSLVEIIQRIKESTSK
jgi:cysteine desulfurase